MFFFFLGKKNQTTIKEITEVNFEPQPQVTMTINDTEEPGRPTEVFSNFNKESDSNVQWLPSYDNSSEFHDKITNGYPRKG
jgi:hypothetical protein